MHADKIQFHRGAMVDADGNATDAMVAHCPCGSVSFCSYFLVPLGDKHMHIQCIGCGATFCDGACNANKEEIHGPREEPFDEEHALRRDLRRN